MRDRDVAAFEWSAAVIGTCIVIALVVIGIAAIDGVLHHFGLRQ